ncbi:N-6 DNA methylase [Desulfococcaceae bacterium HSG9]|nr:N-6 DNA methylase [Desulfococcaceae bacterium HSG9]
MPMFQKSVINKYLSNIDQNLIETAYQTFKGNYTSTKIEKIKRMKEEEYQDGFLRDLFVSSLGYVLKPDDNFNLVREFKNLTDGGKADGAILKDGMAIAVIELKSAKTKELKSITEQAFNYKNNQPECKYVITSNFHKLRFYIDYSNEFVEFNLFDLSKKKFEVLYLVLSKESVFAGTPIKLKKESVYQEENISKQFYKDYSDFKNKLFENLIKNNPEHDKLTLFKKSQKLIDRFLFILFAEDRGLLQPNLINRIIQRYKILEEQDFKQPLYDIFKQFFGYLNTGCKGKKSTDDIPAYNGGLFCPDETLDRIIIDDATLLTDLPKLSSYDFNTELDVDILGHIFEHSLSEIEEITAELKGVPADKAKSKRKKDGVFYTPKYITQYIVENTIGRLCTEKRDESELTDIEIDDTCHLKSGKLSEKGKQLYSKIEDYKSWLLSLKIVDPACGSGAFLNQALNFLIDEHRFIIELETELKKGQISLFNIEAAVLENNLYGVDINEESVEIAKLSLWLRTARKGRKLTDLSNNIKCGNSLIDDPEIAGERAFKWENEFSEIMEHGGFDVVIGNPPYFNIQTLGVGSKEAQWIQRNYSEIWQDKSDILFYFVYKALELSKNEIGFIISNAFLFSAKAQKLRNKIIMDGRLHKIVNFEKYLVFADASITSCITLFSKHNRDKDIKSIVLKNKNYSTKEIIDYIYNQQNLFNINLYKNSVFALVDKNIGNLNKAIDCQHRKLNEICHLGKGMETAANNVFLFDKYPSEYPKNFIKKRMVGENIDRYFLKPNNTFLLYFEDVEELDLLPESIQKHLKVNEDFLLNRATVKNEGRVWWRYSRPMHKKYYHLNKIWCSYRGKNNAFYLDESSDYIGLTNTTVIFDTNKEYSLKYILVLLNSKLLNFRYKSIGKQTGSGVYEYFANGVGKLPIPNCKSQQPFIEKADLMLDLNKQLQNEQNNFLNTLKEEKGIEKISKKIDAFYNLEYAEFKKELRKKKVKIQLGSENNEWREYFDAAKQKIKEIQSLINNTDREIDLMVYKLYDLTDEEIKIVESGT